MWIYSTVQYSIYILYYILIFAIITIFFLVLQASSLGVEVKDPAAWGVTARNSPGGDPFGRALTAVTVACSRMLQDGDGRPRKAVNGALGPALSPSLLPSQVSVS